MLPKNALKSIRQVTIYYWNCIAGFSFFDKDGTLLWRYGFTTYVGLNKETVHIDENEVIIGVKAKLYEGCQSKYSDFSFVIASHGRWE